MADDSGSCFNETSMHVIICYFKIQSSQSTHWVEILSIIQMNIL